MTKRAVSKKAAVERESPADFGWKNILPLLFLACIAIVIIYSLSWLPAAQKDYTAASEPSRTSCTDGMTQSCIIGNCSGTVLCVNGVWSGCRWKESCTPGSRIPCLSESCPYGVKMCNECGTGYGACTAP